jgi:hypothetical protein
MRDAPQSDIHNVDLSIVERMYFNPVDIDHRTKTSYTCDDEFAQKVARRLRGCCWTGW